MIDRGFIKWQPFNSLTTPKAILTHLKQEKKIAKPILFPDKMELLNKLILEAYYSKTKVKITFYEAGKIKTLETYIKKINPSNNIIFTTNKVLYFTQIINIII